MANKSWVDEIKSIQARKNETVYGDKYFYTLKITTGLLIGQLIDLIVPCTFNLFSYMLKGFGKCWYAREIKLNKFNKIFKAFYN